MSKSLLSHMQQISRPSTSEIRFSYTHKQDKFHCPGHLRICTSVDIPARYVCHIQRISQPLLYMSNILLWLYMSHAANILYSKLCMHELHATNIHFSCIHRQRLSAWTTLRAELPRQTKGSNSTSITLPVTSGLSGLTQVCLDC
jgi:hypothetical protein